MRVLIVDDEPLALRRLKTYFADIGGVQIVGECSNGDAAIEAVAALQPDLVILDIQMPEKNGLRAAAEMAGDPRPEIVFVTAHEHYAPDAFEVEAADYLLKPVRLDRLRLAVDRARRRRTLQEKVLRVHALEAENAALRGVDALDSGGYQNVFWVQVRDGVARLPITDIDWIEAAKDYVLFHTAMRSYLHRVTMSALEEKLDPNQLMRVHRSAFLRPEVISELRRANRSTVAVLRDGASVQIGPNYIDALERRLAI